MSQYEVLNAFGGGRVGASAYEIYAEVRQAAGQPVLSKAQWLDSLRGEDGYDDTLIRQQLTVAQEGVLVVSNAQQGIAQRVTALEEALANLPPEYDDAELRADLATVGSQVTDFASALVSATERLDAVEQALANPPDEYDDSELRASLLEAQGQIAAVSGLVGAVEGALAAALTRLTAVEQALLNLPEEYDDTQMRDQISDAVSRIATLEAAPPAEYDDSELVNRITTLETTQVQPLLGEVRLLPISMTVPAGWEVLGTADIGGLNMRIISRDATLSPPEIISAIADRIYTQGGSTVFIYLNTKFSGATTYTLTPTLPGMTLTGDAIRINPMTPFPATRVTVRGINADGWKELGFDLTVRIAAPTVAMPLPDLTMSVGETVVIDARDYFNGAELEFSSDFGTWDGYLLTIEATVEYDGSVAVTATNSTGSVSQSFALLVEALQVETYSRDKIGAGVWAIPPIHEYVEGSSPAGGSPFGWFYNWKPQDDVYPEGSSRTVEFVPMIWGMADLGAAIPLDATALLGFNEPDGPELTHQAAMTVTQALDAWPQLEAYGLPLGSPAPTPAQTFGTGTWLKQFMDGAATRGLRVDFMAVHYYSTNPSVEVFKQWIDDVYAAYQRPIWVTEWALIDWSDITAISAAQGAAFAAEALRMLDDHPHVVRHAIFAPQPWTAPWNGVTTQINLVDQAVTARTVVGDVVNEALLKSLPFREPVEQPNNEAPDLTGGSLTFDGDDLVITWPTVTGIPTPTVTFTLTRDSEDVTGEIVGDRIPGATPGEYEARWLATNSEGGADKFASLTIAAPPTTDFITDEDGVIVAREPAPVDVDTGDLFFETDTDGVYVTDGTEPEEPEEPQEPEMVTGALWLGDYDSTSITVTDTMMSGATTARIAAVPVNGGTEVVSPTLTVDPTYNYVRTTLTGLNPGTRYRIERRSATGHVSTNPGFFTTRPATREAFSFGFASCGRHDRSDPIYDTIVDQNPEFRTFMHFGDRHYGDINTNDVSRYHNLCDQVMAHAGRARLHRAMPVPYIWDDHDFGRDNSTGNAVERPAAVTYFRSRVPARPHLTGALDSVYRLVTPMPGFHVAFLDQRADRYSSTMLISAAQESWLIGTIENLGADDVLAIATGVPWVAANNVSDTWGPAFEQRQRIANAIAASAPGRAFVLAGDMHALAYDDGTSVNNIGGMHVCHAAPLGQTTSTKGGPYSGGTSTATQTQYGRIDATPVTGGWSIRFRGYSVNSSGAQTLRMDHSFTLLGTAPEPEPEPEWSATGGTNTMTVNTMPTPATLSGTGGTNTISVGA